jgi:hypothetical protein
MFSWASCAVAGAWTSKRARRCGAIDEREPVEPSALAACAELALAGGAFLARPFEPKNAPDADLVRKARRFSASCDGFDDPLCCASRPTTEVA